MGSVVVVNDVSPVVRTCYVDRVGYCGFGVVGIFKTQRPFLFVCCIRYIDREPQEVYSKIIVFACQNCLKRSIRVTHTFFQIFQFYKLDKNRKIIPRYKEYH